MSRKGSIRGELGYTEKIHNQIAVPRFYNKRGFINVKSEVGTYADLQEGIDYTAVIGENHVTIQERFRRYQYRNFGDITFRYDSKVGNSIREYFKIKADFFLYGIANKTEDDFEWAVLVCVPELIEAIESGKIKYDIKENRGFGDSRFMTILIDDIEAYDEGLIERI